MSISFEADPTTLVCLLCVSGRAREWCFFEECDSLAAAALPPLPHTDGDHLRLLTLPADGEQATGGRVWHSAPVLCKWLCGEVLHGHAVCELGSGTGACGLFAAALGANVVLTDGASELLPLISRNSHRNQHRVPQQITCEVALLRWGTSDLPSAHFDWVLGSDLIYDAEAHSALCVTLQALMRPRPPPRVIFSTMPRQRVAVGHRQPDGVPLFADAAMTQFEAVAASHGLQVSVLGDVAGTSTWTATEWSDAHPFVFEVKSGRLPST